MKLHEFAHSYLRGDLQSPREKIPWDSPEFSARMLREHLSQEHDLASRRTGVIDQHVEWIDSHVLNRRPSKVLDLGCGPGLYCERLAARGHRCVGIDFSPASIAHARQRAAKLRVPCEYRELDVLTAEYGEDYDLVLMIYGELNTFRDEDARTVLAKSARACRPRGTLLLEIHTPEWVEGIARRGRTWEILPEGLFSNRSHLLLREARWDEAGAVATESFYVVDADSASVESYRSTTYRVSRDQMRAKIEDAGLRVTEELPGLSPAVADERLYVLLARRT